MCHRKWGFAFFIYHSPAILVFLVFPVLALPTQSFQVGAIIANGCLISGTNTGVFGQINFGTYPGTSTAQVNGTYTQSSTITLACTPNTLLNMSINGGANYTSTRNLKVSGQSYLVPYSLYNSTTNAAIPINSNVAVSFSNANNITLPIYGLLTLNGNNYSGLYTDTLTVTLTW
ncbi:spore coat U domain-containing protein [Yersinia nurmii]|uniref:Spore coat U domain-containing protein n=1 Tax=Yersinia nurmii TaxID=685706 RepID=A0AAW7K7C6_9GAMM|nr:spore coat U domain-containing protein [Yersinia nurmii]MDN0086896.1 spore coat U domain-containing protein [Yersinia nurmii]CNE29029.1 spore coat U domain-containing protein [Yersinia nurmii]